jgi:hypothetical protein
MTEGVVGKKKRLQMQKRPERRSERSRPQKFQIEEPTEAQEQEHAEWLARHGHEYISLAETVLQLQRSPEQILRWERMLDQQDA